MKCVRALVNFTFTFRRPTRFCHRDSQLRSSGPTMRSASCAAWAFRPRFNSFHVAQYVSTCRVSCHRECQFIQSTIQGTCRRSRGQFQGNVIRRNKSHMMNQRSRNTNPFLKSFLKLRHVVRDVCNLAVNACSLSLCSHRQVDMSCSMVR